MKTIDTCIHDNDPDVSDFEVTGEICRACLYFEACAIRISKPDNAT